jgi:DNA-binding NtrC family response regulator
VQAKLLRAIEEKEIRPVGQSHPVRVDVRLIASTNADLAEAVREGRFREDLWYRLNVFPITVPPLRERKEDIPLLAEHFLRRSGRGMRKDVRSFTKEAVDTLVAYDWPGNVRELENVVERAVIVADAEEVGPQCLSIAERAGRDRGGVLDVLVAKPLHEAKNEFERLYLGARMDRAPGGRMTELAEELGIHRTTLYELLRKHGMTTRTAGR